MVTSRLLQLLKCDGARDYLVQRLYLPASLLGEKQVWKWAAEVPLLRSRRDLSWCFWRNLLEIKAGRVETVYPAGDQLHARWTSPQSVSPGVLLFMGSRFESFYQLPGDLLEKLLSLSFKMEEKRKGVIFKEDWATSTRISLLYCALSLSYVWLFAMPKDYSLPGSSVHVIL